MTVSRLPSEGDQGVQRGRGAGGGVGWRQPKHLNLPADVHKSLCVITCNIISTLRPVHEAMH